MYMDTGPSKARPPGEELWRVLGDDGEELSCARKCCMAVFCGVLTLYFIPMLSFIPLVVFGGVQLPSPFAAGYNNRTAAQARSDGGPTTGGEWYWHLPSAFVVVFVMPVCLVFLAYLLKTRLTDAKES
mmetsp:Transcript_47085/g.127012  ORF Transcript_47085/g.127012 Transcript_47085/m.127012 type:complete len:128 (-) Transcript_47085:98-481(-)